MPTKRAQMNITMDPQAADNLETVANGVRLTRSQYASLVLSRFADLRPEVALHALTAIPEDYFRRRAGRPSSAAGRAAPSDDRPGEHAA